MYSSISSQDFTDTTLTQTASHQPPATQPNDPTPLTMAALARHNANQQVTAQSEAEATRARQEAMDTAAQSMNFELSDEEPSTGRQRVEEWLNSQDKTYGRYVGSQDEAKKQ
jgi:hypothetical protein